MGRNKLNDNPVDMSQNIERAEYVPPDKSMCDLLEMPIDLGEGHEVYIKQQLYKNLTVDFAIMQYYTDMEVRHEVQRVDCCHSEVHEHIFSRTKKERRRVIAEIHVDHEPWKTVDAEYEPAYDRYIDGFQENQRRWRDD